MVGMCLRRWYFPKITDRTPSVSLECVSCALKTLGAFVIIYFREIAQRNKGKQKEGVNETRLEKGRDENVFGDNTPHCIIWGRIIFDFSWPSARGGRPPSISGKIFLPSAGRWVSR